MHKASLFMGDLLYGKDFRLGPETRMERDNGDHSFHTSCVLYGGIPFKAIILGVLKGVVRLNDTDKYAEQEESLTKMVEMDRARRPKVVLSESSWVQDDTVIITTCALTKMNVVESGANAGRASCTSRTDLARDVGAMRSTTGGNADDLPSPHSTSPSPQRIMSSVAKAGQPPPHRAHAQTSVDPFLSNTLTLLRIFTVIVVPALLHAPLPPSTNHGTRACASI
ncbi:hypothetical protein B0H13DRAFT_2315285 [Mycena leptocephala]|nr:hypothetical protein B0H13DRAFT_2315285 [Mycena leptocephala]